MRCVLGIGRILGAGRSVRTQMVACLSVLSCSNAWRKPSMGIGAVYTFLSSVKVQVQSSIPCSGAESFLELCLAWSQSLNLC